MTPAVSAPRVLAVIVTFHPDAAALQSLLQVLAPQVHGVLVVDNTPAFDTCVETLLAGLPHHNIQLRRLGENLGIAKALNVGVDATKAAGATHVLLSDQDSLPAADMVAGLLHTYSSLVAQGEKVGAVAPTFTDRNTGITFPFQSHVPGKFFYGHVRPDRSRPVVEVLTLITSGTLVPIEVFADDGMMREDLFIDHVDIEWSHRVRARGWKLYGTCNATMFHHMGDDYLRVWYFGWRRESSYSPLRMYYRIRNFIAICRSSDIDWRWKVRNGWYWLGFVYSHVVFGPRKLGCLSMAVRGLCDGLRGRLGRYEPT